MRLHQGEIFHLLDVHTHFLGTVEIKELKGERVRGRFLAAADFSLYRTLFLEHEEAANAMDMGTVEELDEKIDALGLYLASPDRTRIQGIYLVQIMKGEAISFRVRLGYQDAPTRSDVSRDRR